ncbi:MAG TPA: glycosyltransferase [Acidimicrobiales bacterium]|nr:glycosyltransferase [Acidimicrobiales bacterium]
MPPALTVVVVHRNRPERFRTTVDALRAQTVPTRVLVIDTGSEPAARDEVAAMVAERPEDELVAAGVNLGFGPGANEGLRRWLATGEATWVGLCPHDALPAPDCAERVLAAVAPRPRAGLASADVGDRLSPVVDRYFGTLFRPAAVDEGWEPVDYPHGTLLFASRACLEDVGLFDERYFSYCEEADLGLRARARGWEIGLVRGARVTNTDLSSSVAVVDYLQLRNTCLLTREHFGRYAAFIRITTALLQLVSQTLRPARRPLVFHARARVRALRDHLRGSYGPPPDDL